MSELAGIFRNAGTNAGIAALKGRSTLASLDAGMTGKNACSTAADRFLKQCNLQGHL
jgi:hypothetical protein